MTRDRSDSVGVAAGFSCLAVGIAAALVPLRGQLGAANAALILVLVVVGGAAIGGRLAGGSTAIAAALSFNFFYTKPYLTLRIHSGRDVLTVGLLLGAGLAVGELAAARSRQSFTRRSHLQSMRSLESVGALVTAGASSEAVWSASREALIDSLGVLDATFEPGEHRGPLPIIERDGHVHVTHHRFLGNGFSLPDNGAAVDVEADGRHLGQITLLTDPNVGVTREQRRAAVAIADQFAIAYQREFHRA
ncbi:MAG: DUF4118 domain-containing protein [Actinomycetia bacterium]|nr:DUF4118 domain-containing protein [Actinomycetes bacterium]